MMALLLAIALQTPAPSAAPALSEQPAPPLTAVDPCVELQGNGRGLIGGQRFRGRALAKAVAERIPAGRPLFIRFANERASNDIEGMTAAMAGGANAPSIVIVETCDLPGGAQQ
ncbi:hypothetical protein [Brevundimonas sp.]|uniref:hypothetical protein n=1 Tax=Brevundimonas sp. TaxID=1871086 RepID=UPI002FC9E997